MPAPRAVLSAIQKELQMQAVGDRQDGLITTKQLHALGFSNAAIDWRVKTGRLYRVFRGVYAIGRRDLSDRARARAAALAIGDDTTVGYWAAAWLHDFWTRLSSPIDIVVPRQLRSRKGITIHTVAELPPFIRVHGIRVTTAEWTILDLATVVRRERTFKRLVHEAQAQERTSVEMLAAAVKRWPDHRGAERVAAEIAYGPTPTRSGEEDDVVELLRSDPSLPPFETCAHPPGTPGWVEADVLFPDQKVVIEYDGGPWHDTTQRRSQTPASRRS